MKQLISPNLTVQGKAGWCLWVAQEVWGVPHLYPKAIDAWNAGNQRTDPLPDVAVPVYWTFFDRTDGVEYGHIATYVPNRGVYSSPFNSSYGGEWYPSIQAITERVNQIAGANCRYLGWSETLSGVQLVTEDNSMITPSDVDVLRILHTEVGGWDFEASHNGKNDAAFMSACIGMDTNTLVRGQWNEKNAQAFRAKRIAAIDFYDNKRPALEAKVIDLGKVIAIKGTEIKKLTAELAVQSNDTQLLNGFGAWLTKIIVRLGLKG